MTRPVSVGRFSRIGALGMFGSCLLSLVLFGCPGTIEDPTLLGAGGTTGTGGAAGGTGGAGGGAPVGCAMAPMIFMGKCLACHSTATKAAFGGFDMEVAGWEKKMIGMGPAADAPDSNKCKGMNQTYLKAGMQPASGLFLDKLRTPPCGGKMPMIGTLSATELTCIQQWADGVVAAGP
jgi:hypothetical protein